MGAVSCSRIPVICIAVTQDLSVALLNAGHDRPPVVRARGFRGRYQWVTLPRTGTGTTVQMYVPSYYKGAERFVPGVDGGPCTPGTGLVDVEVGGSCSPLSPDTSQFPL
jgi:hypothetical protein